MVFALSTLHCVSMDKEGRQGSTSNGYISDTMTWNIMSPWPRQHIQASAVSSWLLYVCESVPSSARGLRQRAVLRATCTLSFANGCDWQVHLCGVASETA
jgi:hypothetical protein